MKTIDSIKTFASSISGVVYANKHFDMPERAANGEVVLYRTQTLPNGDILLEGFRASMADGAHKTYSDELAKGFLWVGPKRHVMADLSVADRKSSELVPLKMSFHESKYEEFFIAEDSAVVSFKIRASLLISAEEVAA